MGKGFVEYQIQSEFREQYLYYMQTIQNQTGLELLEGSDQEGLFVEIWPELEYAAFLILKAERLEMNDNSVWKPLEAFISGGLQKQHIWHFRKP